MQVSTKMLLAWSAAETSRPTVILFLWSLHLPRSMWCTSLSIWIVNWIITSNEQSGGGTCTLCAVQEAGKVPPGNQKDNDTWTPKRQQKGEIKLTPGKGLQDLSCSVTDLIGQVVKANKVGLCSCLIYWECNAMKSIICRQEASFYKSLWQSSPSSNADDIGNLCSHQKHHLTRSLEAQLLRQSLDLALPNSTSHASNWLSNIQKGWRLHSLMSSIDAGCSLCEGNSATAPVWLFLQGFVDAEWAWCQLWGVERPGRGVQSWTERSNQRILSMAHNPSSETQDHPPST